jgi:cathepsin A (carboxypeptidase C)
VSDSTCQTAQLTASDKIGAYLDLPDVREKLGVDKSVGHFSSCAWTVNAAFNGALDSTDQTWLYVAQLLERDVRILNVSTATIRVFKIHS